MLVQVPSQAIFGANELLHYRILLERQPLDHATRLNASHTERLDIGKDVSRNNFSLLN